VIISYLNLHNLEDILFGAILAPFAYYTIKSVQPTLRYVFHLLIEH
jgi:hypothetical protein